MKKSNWIVLGICVVVSVFLLWLWYYLNFDRIDNPLDLVLSICWWLLIAVTILAIWRLEKRRKERIRTIYVGDRFWFNSELGKKGYSGPDELMVKIGAALEELKYNFHREDFPDAERLPVRFLIRTKKYRADSDEQKDNKWIGTVCLAGEDSEHPFETREQLSEILNTINNTV